MPSSASFDNSGKRGDTHGRRAAEPRLDAQIVRGKLVERDRLVVPCTLAHQPLAQAERGREVRRRTQSVRGSPLEPGLVLLPHIEAADTAAQQGHESRQQPLAELSQRACLLKFPDQRGRARLDPPLLVDGGGAVFQHVNRSGEAAGLVRGVGERNGLGVVPASHGLDRSFERLNRLHDAPRPSGGQGGRSAAAPPRSPPVSACAFRRLRPGPRERRCSRAPCRTGSTRSALG